MPRFFQKMTNALTHGAQEIIPESIGARCMFCGEGIMQVKED